MTFTKILTQTDPKLGPVGMILEFTGEPQRTAPVCRVFREYAEKQYERLCTAYARDPYLKAYLPKSNNPEQPRLPNAARAGQVYTTVMERARKDNMQLQEATLGLHPPYLSDLSKARDIWNFFAEVARKLPAAQQFVSELQGDLVTKAQAITTWTEQHRNEVRTNRCLNFSRATLSHIPLEIGSSHVLVYREHFHEHHRCFGIVDRVRVRELLAASPEDPQVPVDPARAARVRALLEAPFDDHHDWPDDIAAPAPADLTLWERVCEIATLIIDWIAEKIGALVRALTQPFRS